MTLSYLGKAAGAVVLVLLSFELTVRLFALSHDRQEVADPDFGRVGAAGSTVRWGSEGRGTTHYVADGEIATPHSGGPNVLVFGDSHTEALQVDDHEKFVSVAERLLWQRGLRLDLRNFARTGASMADYVWLTRRFRERFQPTAIVIQLDEHDFDWHAFDPSRANHFVLRPDGRIEVSHFSDSSLPAQQPTTDQGIYRQFKMLGYARYRIRLLFNKPATAPPAPPSGLSTTDSVTMQAELLREAAGSVPVILLRLPYSPYSSTRKDLALETFTALRRALPWPYIDPSGEFVESRRLGRDPRTFFNEVPAGAHLNADGHAIVGALLAAEIERALR